MKIKWYGHASFRITAHDGTTIITDPYTPETAGYKPFSETSDIVMMSSDNDSFHCRADLIPGDPIIINALTVAQQGGTRTEKGILFQAIEAMEALNHKEHDPDQNGMYKFEVDGLMIGHMGDVGNPLSKAQLDFFKDVDVLLALVGGHPTITLPDLMEAIHTAQPKLIIPMHFRTLRYKPRNMLWITAFLKYFEEDVVGFACESEAYITPEILDQYKVYVLDYV